MNKLKSIRIKLGMTQQEVSEKSGVPYAAYVAYENYYREPPVSRAIMIAKAFGLPVEEIKWRDDNEE